ncbi:DUF6952 family protein [Schleiferia thermophila]|jgi:hypothetical protein|uniref:Uncharacterized protein n=1 Tax=Schleiferia thermophila TaxID=884107 RepID=A0A369AAJ9_9FLAO|nr:hypothetical protein [Schleiferia thermophila]KFD39991.1 hypothetical protein AT05_00960 [Schleiferia thermophila str. Yellowstone]RCX05428.1 hypothetical protein DES35_101713 [Schleiferia thermophila]GCD79069.1 hypothetical protein JCM30197_03160 [Schleiferia thermophila]
MKIPAIKKLLSFDLDQLIQAEKDLYDEKQTQIQIEGEDEGEQLTHVLAAIWIKEQIANGMTENEALRAYTQRVRNSIS